MFLRSNALCRLKVMYFLLAAFTVVSLMLSRRMLNTRTCPGSIHARSFVSHGQHSPTAFISKVLVSNAVPKDQSQRNYASNLRFGYERWVDGKPLLNEPTHFQPERKTVAEVQEFLSRENLIRTPFDTDSLSPYLTTTREVINEAQRVHFNLFKDLFRGKKYAVLFQVAEHKNRGDAAIGVGEFKLVERMGIKILFYLTTGQNKDNDYAKALGIARRYPMKEVVVLLQGGGNICGYPQIDIHRRKALSLFRHYSAVLFSQSIPMKCRKEHFQSVHNLYCCNRNLTILLRDRLSLQIAQRVFNNGTRLLLAPDMAFQLGPLTRHAPPLYDISWQKRDDGERPVYSVAAPESLFPANLSVWRWDWLHEGYVPNNNRLIKVSSITESGLSILQRGRVVVTDRLHGHILSTLLDIPHVLLDNAENKLSSYHNTWTRGLTNCRLASTVEEAVRYALELLDEFKEELPERLSAVDLPPYN